MPSDHGWKWVPVDACIQPLVRALNAAGLRTANSCCGHGRNYPTVLLADGRAVLVLERSGVFGMLARVALAETRVIAARTGRRLLREFRRWRSQDTRYTAVRGGLDAATTPLISNEPSACLSTEAVSRSSKTWRPRRRS